MEPRQIAPATWGKLPPEVQAYILILEHSLNQSLDNIAQLEQKVNELEAGLHRHAAAHHYRALLATEVADQARSWSPT